jgi:hypothetical protein
MAFSCGASAAEAAEVGRKARMPVIARVVIEVFMDGLLRGNALKDRDFHAGSILPAAQLCQFLKWGHNTNFRIKILDLISRGNS